MRFIRALGDFACASLPAWVAIFWVYPVLSAEAAAKAAPLDVLSPFAGIAAGIAIAYAGLPSFRYRTRVQEHVRRIIKEENLIDSLYDAEKKPDNNYCSQDCWGVLYRLGKLREVKDAPLPVKADEHTEVDHSFSKTNGYLIYSGLFASNLDKWIAFSLGGAAITIIWFALLDNVDFHEASINAVDRISFLSSLNMLYKILAILGVVSIGLHLVCWRWEMKRDAIGKRIIEWSSRIATAAAAGLILLTSVSVGDADSLPYKAGTLFGVQTETAIFHTLEVWLFLAVAVPLALLVIGEYLTGAMISEADVALKGLLGRLKEKAANVDLRPV